LVEPEFGIVKVEGVVVVVPVLAPKLNCGVVVGVPDEGVPDPKLNAI